MVARQGWGKPEERIAVYIDLENIAFPFVERCAPEETVGAIAAVFRALADRGTVVARVAVANRRLCREMSFALSHLGIRTYQHHSGANGADASLKSLILSELPMSVTNVIIMSGDHFFVPILRILRAMGKRVEVVAVAGGLSRALVRAADAYILIVPGTRNAAGLPLLLSPSSAKMGRREDPSWSR
jgi:NYN domain-containing protein